MKHHENMRSVKRKVRNRKEKKDEKNKDE